MNIISDNNYVENLIISTGYVVLRNKSYVLSNLMYYILISDESTNYLHNNNTGSSYPAINKEVLSNMNVSVPKSDEILKTFEPLFKEIDKKKKKVESSKQTYEQLIKELGKEVYA